MKKITGAVFSVTLLVMACAEEEAPPIFQLIPVTTRDIVVSASAAGQVEPVRTVEVKSKASGEIMQVRVETGDAVTAGQLLVKVDPRVPRNYLRQTEADLDVARATLENAESQLRRSEELYKSQSITETEWETTRLSRANARAQLIRAQRNFEDAKISFEDTDVRAAIDGVILEKNVEVGTVISSATSNVGGGTVLLRMADLDTVQVRALVDETDIGKIQPGMAVTITVDAYPNQPFRGTVLKIEPQATVQQNVTMFPVLARIDNSAGLLRPGMNAEVEVHVGSREGVMAIPNTALRTTRDMGSAAGVLGIDPEVAQQQLADARSAARESRGGRATFGGSVADSAAAAADSGGAHRETIEFQGRQIPLPPGVTAKQMSDIFAKMRDGGFSSVSAADRAILTKLRNASGGDGRRARGGSRSSSNNSYLFGGDYVVFVMRDGIPTAVSVRTGLTDLDYSEVVSGLQPTDTVIVLPSASLLASLEQQQEFQDRIRSRSLPGVRRN